MSAVEADLAGMAALADRLAVAGEQLCAAGRTLPAAAGAVAAPSLAGAVEEFCDAWRRSLQRTGEAAQVAGSQLRSAAEAYRRVDGAVAGVST